MKAYKEVNGKNYTEKTDLNVINVLKTAAQNKTRIKVYYGDTETGKNWNEEYDTVGYVGYSTGEVSIPILIYNSRSIGGGAILTDCILKIRTSSGKNVLYKHPKYKASKIEIQETPSNVYSDITHETYIDGRLYGRHKSFKNALNLKNKLK